MSIAGSPKKLAQEVADGFILLAPPQLKKYTAADLKTILTHLDFAARDLRQEAIPLEEVQSLKKRNMRLTRIRQAQVVIRAYCKKHRFNC